MERISLSPLLLFMQAGHVGKAVMLVLLMASIWCWVLIVESALSLRRLRRALRGASAPELDPLHESGRRAALRVLPGESTGERRQRIQEALNRSGRRWLAQAERGLAPLAIIASVSPFIGLFGTVWGIMTSFVGIAELKETSLAVVAPGIAEALAATAYGLAAAIPASIGYTRLGAGFTGLAQELGDHFEEKAVELVATGGED